MLSDNSYRLETRYLSTPPEQGVGALTACAGRRRIEIPGSPLAPGVSPVGLAYREAGRGSPLIVLHGGWGYAIYPFDAQISTLQTAYWIAAPDRTGYGGSGPLARQEDDFHQRAAAETLAFFDALGIDRAVVWGHSDGAVIAFHLALLAPSRVSGIVAEATHYLRAKPRSRAFFETMRDNPRALGARVVETLAAEHGARWEPLIRTNGDAWLRIGQQPGDLYDGRLKEVATPTLLVHGARDPRTEPGELDAVQAALDHRAETCITAEGGHSPHSERLTAAAVTACVERWLARIAR